ncbi:MAG: TldD/PmbA family protein [candidate division WOR-3 bacterium]
MRAQLQEAFRAIPAQYGDVRIEESQHTRIVFQGRELQEITTRFEYGGYLRLLSHGNWAAASFNALEAPLRSVATETLALAHLLPPVTGRTVLSLSPARQEVRLDPSHDPTRVPLAQKLELISRYNDVLLASPRIVTTYSVYSDSLIRTHFCSSEDRYLYQERAYAGVALKAIAQDGTNTQGYQRSFSRQQGFGSLLNLEPEVEGIARVASNLLRAESVAPGEYPAVVDPLLAGFLIHQAFGHLCEADTLCQDKQLAELMSLGRRCGPDQLSIVDDGTMPNEQGTIAFDDEGAPASKTFLVRQGVLRAHLHNRQTAAQMGATLTGNARAGSYSYAPIVRMTNTYVEPGQALLDELICGIHDGIYCVGAWGCRTERLSFLLRAQYGYEIKDGKTGRTLRDIVLTGDILETLANITGLGNDLQMFGAPKGRTKAGQALPVGFGSPHIAFRTIRVSRP